MIFYISNLIYPSPYELNMRESYSVFLIASLNKLEPINLVLDASPKII